MMRMMSSPPLLTDTSFGWLLCMSSSFGTVYGHGVYSFIQANKNNSCDKCVLTSRIHIRSLMQDRVFEETGDYSMSLTNQFIGTDVILNDSSISGYENMGFNVKSMTQDVYQGQFTITTDDPIPLMPYGDRYTWAKYGHFIIHNGIIPADNSSVGSDDESPENPDKHSMADNMNSRLTVNHRDCLISFLRTDPDDAASFIVDASSTCLIDEFVNKIFRSLTKRTEKGFVFDAFIEQNADFTGRLDFTD